MIRFLRRTVCDVPFPIFVNKRPFRGGGIHSKGGGGAFKQAGRLLTNFTF